MLWHHAWMAPSQRGCLVPWGCTAALLGLEAGKPVELAEPDVCFAGSCRGACSRGM